MDGIDKEELEEVADEINKFENKDEEIIKQILEKRSEVNKRKNFGENHHRWKNHARVIKAGFNSNGRQQYILKHNGKIIKTSVDKEKLEKQAEEINKKT